MQLSRKDPSPASKCPKPIGSEGPQAERGLRLHLVQLPTRYPFYHVTNTQSAKADLNTFVGGEITNFQPKGRVLRRYIPHKRSTAGKMCPVLRVFQRLPEGALISPIREHQSQLVTGLLQHGFPASGHFSRPLSTPTSPPPPTPI